MRPQPQLFTSIEAFFHSTGFNRDLFENFFHLFLVRILPVESDLIPLVMVVQKRMKNTIGTS